MNADAVVSLGSLGVLLFAWWLLRQWRGVVGRLLAVALLALIGALIIMNLPPEPSVRLGP